ncbi:MAG: TolC family protein, partial [Opitutales bacterium]|nr:TolC family protein [Opitutales bacterium]
LGVYEAYFNLYSAQGNVKAALADIDDAKSAYDSAKARLDNSVGSKQDELRAKATLKNAEYALALANSSVETARAHLAESLGIEVSESLKISDSIEIPQGEEAEKKIDELMAGALRERQTVLAAYSKLEAAKQNVKAAERDFLPKISAQGSMVWTDYTGDNMYGAPYNNYSLGATLSWDLFTGFARKYELISAQAKERAAEQQLKETEIRIISAVWSSYYSYKSAVLQLESSKAAVDASEEAYKATKTAYENGVGTITDLLNSISTLSKARQQQVSAESALSMSIANLAHATGRLNAGIPADLGD